MILIHSQLIHAPIERCFDLARDIDVHVAAGTGIKAKALGGKTTGLAVNGDNTLWQAQYVGCSFQMRTQIYEMEAPYTFKDQKIEGLLATFTHHYTFSRSSHGNTLMEDRLDVRLPFVPFLTPLLLKRSITRAQNQRFDYIKQVAEKST